MKKIIYTILVAMFGVAMFASSAHASVQFNTDPGDMRTVLISNHTQNPCTSGEIDGCWKSSATAKAGDTISVMVYYHNTGNETANNVTLGMNPQSSGSKTTHTFYGGVSANDFPAKIVSATVNLNDAQTITFIPGSVRFYPNQTTSGRTVSNESSLFTRQGFSIGNIARGWESQGSIVASFKVGNTITPNEEYQCNDGRDNDGDGKVDFPRDPGCSSSTDNDEYNNEEPRDQCRIYTFKATDTTIEKGESTSLRWTTTNCDDVRLYPGEGSVDDDGSVTVRPRTDTKYTLKATGRYGSDTETVTVRVQDKTNTITTCSINFFSNASVVNQGGAATLTWNTDGFTSVQILPNLGYKTTDGSITVYPNATTTYTLYGYGCGSVQTRTVVVSVNTVKTVVVTQPPRVIVQQPTRVIRNIVVAQSAPSLLELRVESTYDRMCVNGQMDYTVTYRNISGIELQNAFLQIEHPEDIAYISSSRGDYSVSDRKITIALGSIDPGEEGTITIRTRINTAAIRGNVSVLTASVVYTNADTRAQEQAIAYSEIEVTDTCPNVLGASVFGFGSFLPDTLLEWLLLILVILALIVLGRQLYKKRDQSTM